MTTGYLIVVLRYSQYSPMDFTTLFSKKSKWDWVVILTYDLNPIAFFETEILNKILISRNLTVVIDDANYKRIISDPEKKARFWGVFYNLERVKVRNGGKFHPKIYLFLSETELALHVGSVNLTDSGFKQNLEVLVSATFNRDKLKDEDVDLLFQVMTFLQEAFLEPNNLFEPISQTLKAVMLEIVSSPLFTHVAKLFSQLTAFKRETHFFTSLNRSLFSQIKEVSPKKFEEVSVLSPFYDDSLDTFQSLAKHTSKAHIYIPLKKSTFPKELIAQNNSLRSKFIYYSTEKVEKKDRFIHAKYYRFLVSKKEKYDFVTSANFTQPGLMNDAYPRNLEIGLLFPSIGAKFPSIDGINVTKLMNFDSVHTDVGSHDPVNTVAVSIAVESALYVEGKIVIQISKTFEQNHDLNNYRVLLIVDQVDENKYVIQTSNSEYFIEPDLEIEGNQTIQIKIVSIRNEYESIPIYVNRKIHNPNYLPSLGASAFNECVRIGGVEGIERAFEYARSSGKKDWLLYLLSHWNLDKILKGINIGDETTEIEDDSEIPTLPNEHPQNKSKRMRKNISALLSSIDMLNNLSDFTAKLRELSATNDDLMRNYVYYCFPLFFEISKYFKGILMREEQKKIANPSVAYPAYTWLNNYIKYENYMFMIYSELKKIISLFQYSHRSDSDYYIFLSLTRLWFSLPTNQTQHKFSSAHPAVGSLVSYLTDSLAWMNQYQSKDIIKGLEDKCEYYLTKE